MTCPRLVIFDRDGVLNEHVGSHGVTEPGHLQIRHGVPLAIKRLNDAGIFVGVATNQAQVGRGRMSQAELLLIHERLRELLWPGRIDRLEFCTTSRYNHPRRKPHPGMLLELMKMFDAGPAETHMIGDRDVDIAAARAAGCTAHLVLGGRPFDNRGARREAMLSADYVHANPIDAVSHILEGSHEDLRRIVVEEQALPAGGARPT